MSEIIAVVTTNRSSAIVKQQSDVQVPVVGIQGPSGPTAEGMRLETMANVDGTNMTNGSILVYRPNTQKWTSTTTLDAQNMEGGEF